jgi:prevent-host-death family protein
MKMINIQAAKTHLSRLVEEVAAGEEIVLAKAGKPIAKLIPYAKSRKARIGGFLKGQIWEAAGCWEPDESLNKLMTTGPLFPDEHDDAIHVAEEKPRL